jgi:hypothetical protein
MLLTEAVCTILSLFKVCASPIRLSKHNVMCRREGDALARRLDVANEELTVGIAPEFLSGSVTIPQRRASSEPSYPSVRNRLHQSRDDVVVVGKHEGLASGRLQVFDHGWQLVQADLVPDIVGYCVYLCVKVSNFSSAESLEATMSACVRPSGGCLYIEEGADFVRSYFILSIITNLSGFY